ncbi:Fe-S cluster assembly protein SufD [Ligilactobacillus equi]|uniref:Fe-S cluster assembly protein SufD n=1 Tax=Ligilactobacillus equi TaxID=137357 RepID=UPI002ED07CED
MSWLEKRRQEVLEVLPTLKNPSFAKINYSDWGLNMAEVAPFSATPVVANDASQTIIQVDGHLQKNVLPKELLAAGVIICDWQEALNKHSDLLAEYFMTKASDPKENQLLAEHFLNLQGGLFIYVPKNVRLKKPLTVTFYQHSAEYVHHLLIVAGQNSEFTYFENRKSLGEKKACANIIEEVVALTNSKVKFIAVDRLAKQTTAYLKRISTVGRDAEVDWALGCLNDGNVVNDFDSDLKGIGAQGISKVIAITTDSQKQGVETKVTNYGQNTYARIFQHGVLLGESGLVFNGIGHILNGAHGSDSQQENRVLMLSDHARGDANPILLIDDNEVNAGHAASVGQVDEEQLYYLMSRGYSRKDAQRLVVRAFLGPVIDELPLPEFRAELSELVERKVYDGQYK